MIENPIKSLPIPSCAPTADNQCGWATQTGKYQNNNKAKPIHGHWAVA